MTANTEQTAYDKARARVNATPELDAHSDTIFADWSREGDDHYKWVATAPVAEIVDWAETVELHAETAGDGD